MINSIHSDLIRGHIDTIILSVLHEGDRYGYDILGEIEKKSGGQYALKQPTLYSCLKRLETQGFIYKYWGTETNGGRRTYYSLTEMGKELFRKNKDEWVYSRGVIDKLISTEGETISSAVPEQKDADAPGVEAAQTETSVVPEERTEVASGKDENFAELNDTYADILAGAAAEELKSEAGATAYSEDNVNGYCYADGISQDVPAKEKEPLLSSLFAKDYSEDVEDELEEEEADAPEEEAAIVPEEPDDAYPATAFYKEEDFVSEVPGQYTMFDMIESPSSATREIRNEVKEPTFRRYDTAILSEEADRELIVGREYRNVIKQLLTGDSAEDYFAELQHATEIRQDAPVPETEIAATTSSPATVPLSEQNTGKANFDELMITMRSMGDDIRIRTHHPETGKNYSNLYHYYSNKLNLFRYGIIFALMILEIIIPYVIIKFGGGVRIAGELPVLVISVVFAALFPVYSVCAYFVDPNKRKRYHYNMKTSLLYRTGIFALLLVLIYAANVVFYMQVNFEVEYLFSLIMPALLSTNVIVSSLLFKKLYDTKKFAAE